MRELELTRLADIPGDGRGACASVEKDGKVYVFGGKNRNIYSNEVSIYDIATNTWSKGEPMPLVLGYHASERVGENVYVMAGLINNTTLSKKLLIYNIPTNSWKSGSDMPAVKSHVAVFVHNNEIYQFGGKAYTTAYKYNIATDTWATLPTLPMQ